MALNDLIRSGVAIADSLTISLQSTVQHESFLGQTIYGATWSSAIPRTAIVELRSRLHQTRDGRLVDTRAMVLFPRDIAVDHRDKITLPDGSSGPIVDVVGVVNPDTSRPYATEVWIGITAGQ